MRQTLLLNFTCWLLVAVTCSSLKAADYPWYDGEISLIGKPILLRNRPHLRSQMSKRSTATLYFGQEKINFMQLITGNTKVIYSGSSIIQIMEGKDMVIETQGQQKKEKFPSILIMVKLTPRGEYLGIDLKGSDISDEDKKKIDEFFPAITNLLNSTINVLPETGIIENHEFFNITESTLHISRYIPSKYIPKGLKLTFSYRGIASGVTQYRGREAIVINISGKITMGDIRIGNNFLNNVRIRLGGYALMDTHTGRWIFSETFLEGDGKLGELDVSGDLRETMELNLNSLTPKHKYSSKAASTKMSLQDAKKECAELGFKKGTEKYGSCVLRLH